MKTFDLKRVELVKLPIEKMEDVLVARFLLRQQASKLGASNETIARITTAISEITRNVVQYAGVPGEALIYRVEQDGRKGLKVVVRDEGVGIEAPEKCLSGNAVGNGAGLPGTRDTMDEFELQSGPSQGTVVSFCKWFDPDHD